MYENLKNEIKQLGIHARYLKRMASQLEDISDSLADVLGETEDPERVKKAVEFYKQYRINYVSAFGTPKTLEDEMNIWDKIDEGVKQND